MQTYNEFLTQRIKTLSDAISYSASDENVDIVEVSNMAKEIYSYCKVIEHLNRGGSFVPPSND